MTATLTEGGGMGTETHSSTIQPMTATEDDTAAIVVKCTGQATADDDIEQLMTVITREE